MSGNGCEVCGSLSPWRCGCCLCSECDEEYTPALSDAQQPTSFCSVACEDNAASNHDDDRASGPASSLDYPKDHDR